MWQNNVADGLDSNIGMEDDESPDNKSDSLNKNMNITTVGFLLFLLITLFLFYMLPKVHKWKALLIAGLVFIAVTDIRGIIFIVLTAFSIWQAGLHMDKGNPKKGKVILLITMFFNLGILFALKYLTPFLNSTLLADNKLNILVPLGISYYTLQAISYILDVYWERTEAEKNFFKVLLFVSYFPQMLQGPINRYKDLSSEIYEKDHTFDLSNIASGGQLMIWGYFKTLVISEYIGGYVRSIFHSGQTAYGLTVFFGFVLFGIQLYTNFSGGIDIVRGVSECFGIILPDNFRQPFFSKSLGEFWRRWHITLGAWMKDYVFYPFSMSSAVSKTKKKLKKHVSRRMANRIPIAVANVVVFLIVGIWHGFGTNYALWGLYNGIILGASEILADYFVKTKKKLKINESSKSWNIFCLVRTFVIVTLGWCTDCATSAAGSFALLRNMLNIGMTDFALMNIGIGGIIRVGILIYVGILHEKNISIREKISEKNTAFQVLFWIIVIQAIVGFGVLGSGGGFMYADF